MTGLTSLFDRDSQRLCAIETKAKAQDARISYLESELNKQKEITTKPRWNRETIIHALDYAELNQEQKRMVLDYLSSY